MSERNTINDLDSAPTDGAALLTKPVVFIGLGGAGALALQHLRRRYAERRGKATNLPPWRFLALDTDAAGLRPTADSPAALSCDETLHLPLRKPADYRAASDDILSWLSRRWLYNIPRSLRTEGLRPLGRLAFVDHRLVIAERLRGLLPGPSPRVFIVASIDGGAGGGMLLDVAYAVRQQLDELKLSTDCLCGLLLHATFARGAANDLRKANAYATLTELNHFMQGNAAYRAGPVEVLPAGDVSEPPFHDAYLIDLGEELSDADFDDGLRRVAEYLYLNATSCAALLDDFRRTSRAVRTTTAGAVPLRSFGLRAVRVNKQAIADREANRLCLGLVQDWLGESGDGSPSGAAIQPPEFTLDDIVRRVQAIGDKALGGSAETHFQSLVMVDAGLASLRTNDPAGPFADQLRRIHAVFGLPTGETAHPESSTRLEAILRGGSQKVAAAMGDLLVESIQTLLDQPRGRLPAALAAANLFERHLRELRQAAGEALRQEQSAATSLWSSLQRGDLPRGRAWLRRASAANDDAERLLLDYCRLRMRAMVYKYVTTWLQEVAAKITALSDRLARLRQTLRSLSAEFAAAPSECLTQEGGAIGNLTPQRELRPFAEPSYLLEFENTQVRPLLAAQGGFMALAEDDRDRRRQTLQQLHALARDAVLHALGGVDAGSVLFEQYATGQELAGWVAEALSKAAPRLPTGDTPGSLFVVSPRNSGGERIRAAVLQQRPGASCVVSCDGDVVLLSEVDGIVLSDAAAALVASCDDCAEAARRVLTRVDVSWTMLPTEHNAGV